MARERDWFLVTDSSEPETMQKKSRECTVLRKFGLLDRNKSRIRHNLQKRPAGFRELRRVRNQASRPAASHTSVVKNYSEES